MSGQPPLTTSYRVEISGWDTLENFFVEKTTLEWSEEKDKIVFLRHSLRPGSVVFVRLIDSKASTHTFPIAYQADTVQRADSQGLYRVALVQLRPDSPAFRTDGSAKTNRNTAK